MHLRNLDEMRWTGEQRRVIYDQLATINGNFEQVRASLALLRRLPGFERAEIDAVALLTNEARAACLSYVLNVMETSETDEAARLQSRRLRTDRNRT